jgi:beta-N-acetylhexosaminidase
VNAPHDHSLFEDAHAVILAVLPEDALDPATAAFLTNGGRAVLLGETREEYVARAMSADRMERETPEWLSELTEAVHEHAGGRGIVALDQEMPGIQRLHRLVPPLPGHSALSANPDSEIEEAVGSVARAARVLGVTLFLSPIVDVYRAPGPTLAGRVVLADAAEVGRIGAAYIRGAQSEGVAATAKHFPGEGLALADPHLGVVRIASGEDSLQLDLSPFRDAIAADVAAVMLGATVVEQLDASLAASVSPAVVRTLRDDLGFDGVVISDDLDMASIEAGRGLGPTIELALNAGVDLLLFPGGEHALVVATSIVAAVDEGRLSHARIAEAAARVRRLAAAPHPS